MKSTLASFILFAAFLSGSVLAEKPAVPSRLVAAGPEAGVIWVLQANPKNLDKYGVYDGATSSFRPAFDGYTKYSLEPLPAKMSERQ